MARSEGEGEGGGGGGGEEETRVAEDIAEFAGGAVPYNKARDKTATMRLLVVEVPELREYKRAVVQAVVGAARTLASLYGKKEQEMASRRDGEPDEGKHCLAIVGVDLLVEACTGKVFILEFNNNPAMPQKGKHRMSEPYQRSLVQLSSDILSLGLRGSGQEDGRDGRLNFTRVDG